MQQRQAALDYELAEERDGPRRGEYERDSDFKDRRAHWNAQRTVSELRRNPAVGFHGHRFDAGPRETAKFERSVLTPPLRALHFNSSGNERDELGFCQSGEAKSARVQTELLDDQQQLGPCERLQPRAQAFFASKTVHVERIFFPRACCIDRNRGV